MGLIHNVKSVFDTRDIPNYDNYYSEYIELWKRIYQGVPPWGTVRRSSIGSKSGGREIALMHAAKVLCAELSSLCFSEEVGFSCSALDYQEYAENVLKHNGFYTKFPDLLELMFAVGGGVTKSYISDNKVKIDFVDADFFIPTSWEGDTITEGVFVSRSTHGRKHYHLFEWRTLSFQTDESKNNVMCCIIENVLYESENPDEIGHKVSLDTLTQYKGLPERVTIWDVDRAMFCYFKPNLSNNRDTNTPLGISIYANALGTLKSLDVALDSFQREFILGRKRIIVPENAIRMVTDNDGNLRRYFDPYDEAYVAFKTDRDGSLDRIVDNTVELRVEEHVAAINALLNILCMQSGLTVGSLSFDGVQGVTATEVISKDNKSRRTAKSHQNIIGAGVEQLIRDIITLGIKLGDLPDQGEYTVEINWNDNIAVDDNTKIDNNIKLVQGGLKSKLSAIMDLYGYDEKTAQKELGQIIKEERQITGADVDWFEQDGEPEQPEGEE